MNKQLPLDDLGQSLVSYIKEQSPYTLAEVAKSTLGITYSNFQKRLSKNKIKMFELQEILNFLQLEIQITIGDMTFQNGPPSSSDYEKVLAQKDKMLQLQDRIIQLQDELQTYRKRGEEEKEG
ncbi:MAG: hypothetical protein AAF694_02720 [Bacteroidota bacterium]